MALEIQRNERVHCRELNTEKKHTGFFLINDERINATFYSFEEAFHIRAEEPVHLQTATNNFISLYLNIDGSSGTTSRPGSAVYHHEIVSSLAVIGPDCWKEAEQVKTVTFRLPYADTMFSHKERLDELSMKAAFDWDAAEIFSVRIGAITYRARYLANYSLSSARAQEIWPILELEFHNGVSVFEYLNYVSDVVALVSLNFAYRMFPESIRIRRQSTAELAQAIERNEYSSDHTVEYIWPKSKGAPSNLWHGYSLLSAWDDPQLDHLKACLLAWIERSTLWKPANILMLRCLALEGEMSATRLLAACTWFEEIPTSKSSVVMPVNDIDQIARSAQEKAAALGYLNLNERIASSLKRISAETRREQLTRLLKAIRDKFGDGMVDDGILKHLEEAMRFRGAAAHGHINTDDDEKYRAFAKAVYAMEAFCFLLTIKDLPLVETSAGLMSQNLFLQNYRLSF